MLPAEVSSLAVTAMGVKGRTLEGCGPGFRRNVRCGPKTPLHGEIAMITKLTSAVRRYTMLYYLTNSLTLQLLILLS